MAVRPISLDGRRVWLKHYEGGSRMVALAAMGFVARRLKLPALRPPPRRPGDQAREVEARRLAQLRDQQVRVPQVLGSGDAMLLLSDEGRPLNVLLREADPEQRDGLVRLAVEAIAAAHRRGAYFGQPLPRNLTWDGHAIGFLDFEEDPLEVMTLAQAQARDWLLFAYGTAKYYGHAPERLQQLLRERMDEEDDQVLRQVLQVTGRLGRLAIGIGRLGRPARVFAQAVLVVHAAASTSLLVALAAAPFVLHAAASVLSAPHA